MPQVAPLVGGLLTSVGVGAGVTAFVTSGIGQLLTSVALSALSRALAPKPRAAGVRTSATLAGGTNADAFVLGWYATEGQLVCPPMSHGRSGKTPNAYLTYVIEVGGIAGHTLDGLIIDGEPVTIGATADPDYGLPILGRFEGRAWIRYHDGTQTAADSMLLDKYADYPERPWSASMVGAGICYAVLTFRYDREVFSGFPKARFVLGGIKLYDPRADSTAGGSGSQRWGSPATWAPSTNPMVMVYNILRGITLPGGEIWGGEVVAADLPFARWAAAMDDCDEIVDGVARYRAGLEVLADDEPYSVIEDLLTACGGQLAEAGGEWVPAVGAPDLPVLFISDDDVIVTDADDFNPFPSPEQTYNGATATYPKPASVWEASEIVPIYLPALEAQDGGRRLLASLSVNACPWARQVRRVAREAVLDSRRWRRHSISLPPDAAPLQPLDTISWTSNRNGYITKSFEVVEVARDLQGASVQVVLRERDPADYDFVAEDLPDSPSLVQVRPVAQSVPGWSVEGVAIVDASGLARRPALMLGWTPDAAEDATGLRWQVRRAGTSGVDLRGSTHDTEGGSLVVADGILPATAYQARARYVIGRRLTQWSDWISASTPGVYVGPGDVSDELIDDITAIAELAGVKPVSALPASGDRLNQIVCLIPPGRLYRWTGSVWTQNLYAGIEAGSLTTAAFAASIRPVEVVAVLPTTDLAAGRMVYLTTDQTLYRYTGSAWSNTTAASQIVGQLIAGQIAAGAIGADQLAAGSVVASKLLISDFANLNPDYDFDDPAAWYSTTAASITFFNTSAATLGRRYAQIAASADAENMLGPWMTVEPSTEYRSLASAWLSSAASGSGTCRAGLQLAEVDAAGAIVNLRQVQIVARTDSLAFAPVAANITTGAAERRARFYMVRDAGGAGAGRGGGFALRRRMGGELIVDGAITAEKLSAGEVITNSAQIRAAIINDAHIANLSVTGASIANATIGGAKIADAAITTAKIGNAAITSAKIGNLQVDTLQIANNAVTTMDYATTAGAVSVSVTSAWTTLQTLTVTKSRSVPVILHAAAEFTDMANGDDTLEIQILRGASLIHEANIPQSGVGNPPNVVIPIVDRSTASGDQVYTMRARTNGWGGSPTQASNRTILCLNALK